MGMEERPGTCAADGILLDLAGTLYEREYGPSVHGALVARHSGTVVTTMKTGFRPLMKTAIGVRNLIPGGGGGGGEASASPPAAPPAPGGGAGGETAGAETLTAVGFGGALGRGVAGSDDTEDVISVARTVGNTSDAAEVEDLQRAASAADNLDDLARVEIEGTGYQQVAEIYEQPIPPAAVSEPEGDELSALVNQGESLQESSDLDGTGAHQLADSDNPPPLAPEQPAADPSPGSGSAASGSSAREPPPLDLTEPGTEGYDFRNAYGSLHDRNQFYRQETNLRGNFFMREYLGEIDAKAFELFEKLGGSADEIAIDNYGLRTSSIYDTLEQMAEEAEMAGDVDRLAEIRAAMDEIERLVQSTLADVAARADEFSGAGAAGTRSDLYSEPVSFEGRSLEGARLSDDPTELARSLDGAEVPIEDLPPVEPDAAEPARKSIRKNTDAMSDPGLSYRDEDDAIIERRTEYAKNTRNWSNRDADTVWRRARNRKEAVDAANARWSELASAKRTSSTSFSDDPRRILYPIEHEATVYSKRRGRFVDLYRGADPPEHHRPLPRRALPKIVQFTDSGAPVVRVHRALRRSRLGRSGTGNTQAECIHAVVPRARSAPTRFLQKVHATRVDTENDSTPATNTSSRANARRPPLYSLGRPSSGPERGERRQHHPVGPGVAVADSDNHHERGRWARPVRIHPIPQLEQAPRPFLDRPLAAELDLDAQPRTARRLDDGVDFQTGIVAVVIHLGVVSLGIDPKVPDGQRLEEEPERGGDRPAAGPDRNEVRQLPATDRRSAAWATGAAGTGNEDARTRPADPRSRRHARARSDSSERSPGAGDPHFPPHRLR